MLIDLLANQFARGWAPLRFVAAFAALAGILLGLITLIPRTGPALDFDEARNKLHSDVAGFAALLDIYDAKTKAQKSGEESLSRRRVYVLSGYLLLLVAVILTTVLILTR